MKFLIAGIFVGLAGLFIIDKFAVKSSTPQDARLELGDASSQVLVP